MTDTPTAAAPAAECERHMQKYADGPYQHMETTTLLSRIAAALRRPSPPADLSGDSGGAEELQNALHSLWLVVQAAGGEVRVTKSTMREFDADRAETETHDIPEGGFFVRAKLAPAARRILGAAGTEG